MHFHFWLVSQYPPTDNYILLRMKSDQQERPLLGTEQKSELRHLLSGRFQRGYWGLSTRWARCLFLCSPPSFSVRVFKDKIELFVWNKLDFVKVLSFLYLQLHWLMNLEILNWFNETGLTRIQTSCKTQRKVNRNAKV